MVTFNIETYTDTVCPWCYIGEHHFEKAIELYKCTYPGASRDTFNFTYIPYFLDADAPSPGIPMKARIAQKNGQDRLQGIVTRLQRTGSACGIQFSFLGKIGSTRDSHRLLRRIGKERPDLQRTLLQQIFHDVFEKDADVSSLSDLTKAAVSVGLDEDDVAAFLCTDEEGPEVDAADRQAREAGVNAVPTFKINGVTLDGDADPTEFYQLLVQARQGE